MPRQRPREACLHHHPGRRLPQGVLPARELHRRRVVLLCASAPVEDRGHEYFGLPPIAANEPILCLIWEQIAILYTNSLEDRSDAAASLVSLARDNELYGKLIFEEEGVGPLLKLIKEGKVEGQENASRAIGLLGRDAESVEHMIHMGVCPVFSKMLKEGPMKVQAVVAWAVSELAANYPKCQDLFAQHNIIRLLVSHLAFETVQEHSKYAIASSIKPNSIHAVVLASNSQNHNNNNCNTDYMKKGGEDDDEKTQSRISHPLSNRTPNQMHTEVTITMAMNSASKQSNQGNGVTNGKHRQQNDCHCRINMKGREFEDPETKATMKAMTARALWHLAKRNPPICRSITESRALVYFAVLLEKGCEDVKYNLAMAMMEITAVAEKDAELRRSAFEPNSPAYKAVIDQVLKIVEKADSESDLLIPCIRASGNLARTFIATGTRMIGPLVKLLDERGAEVSREASVALTKFACTENYLHVDHSKAIISAGGAKHLVQLVCFGEQIVQISALVLLSYIALHVPDSEELAKAEVLTVLEWASKQSFMMKDETLEAVLQEAKSRLELYQSRGLQ